MAKHDFGIMNIPPEPNTRYDSYNPEKYNCISVHNDYIEPLLDKLRLVESYWHTLERQAKGLALYGITLIPPSSIGQFIDLLEGTYGTEELRDLLIKARDADKYVIHFGI